jgi:hypothetical protein
MSLTTYTVEVDGNEIDLTIEYDAVYQPAKVSGPPEDCYPDESSLDITDVTFDLSPDATVTEEQVIAFITQPIMEQKLEEACWEDYMTRGVDDRY